MSRLTVARGSVHLAAGLGVVALLSLAPATASATILMVSDTGDTLAAGQLRTLLAAAADGDTILVPAGTIDLTLGTLVIGAHVTIVGAGPDLTTIDGGGLARVLDVPAGRSLVVSGLTLRRGVAATGVGGGIRNGGTLHVVDVVVEACDAEAGGGIGSAPASTTTVQSSTIRNNVTHGLTAIGGGVFNGGTMDIRESVIHDNLAGDTFASANGGGVGNASVLHLVNTTISGNRANANTGGGVFHAFSATTLTMVNTTIVYNRADANGTAGFGGGIGIMGTNASAVNTLIANNRVGAVTGRSADCSGTLDSLGHNLIEDADGCAIVGTLDGNILGERPRIAALDDNGGPTWTHALQPRSAAVDAGSVAHCAAVDQRGVRRPADGDRDGMATCDIGAFELVRR